MYLQKQTPFSIKRLRVIIYIDISRYTCMCMQGSTSCFKRRSLSNACGTMLTSSALVNCTNPLDSFGCLQQRTECQGSLCVYQGVTASFQLRSSSTACQDMLFAVRNCVEAYLCLQASLIFKRLQHQFLQTMLW